MRLVCSSSFSNYSKSVSNGVTDTESERSKAVPPRTYGVAEAKHMRKSL